MGIVMNSYAVRTSRTTEHANVIAPVAQHDVQAPPS